MTILKAKKLFDTLITGLFFILLIGTPLIFTSYTRSVFEVNKLLILRVIIILVYGVWLFRYLLFKDNKAEEQEDSQNYYSFFGITWKKVGLEIPFLLWIATNIISTLLSQNLKVSIIGSYDRWEGIITILNYCFLVFMFAKLVTKRFQLKWILIGTLIPAGLSAIYGTLQSTGWDFMHWSVNPTARVFACINNPVHFCAYMGMVIPLSVGWLLFIASTHNYEHKIKPHLNWTRIKHALFAISLLITNVFLIFIDNPFLPLSFSIGDYISTFTDHAALYGLAFLGYYLCTTTTELFHSKKNLLKLVLFIGLCITLIATNAIDYASTKWATLFILLGAHYIIAPLPKKTAVLSRCIYIFTLLIFYAQYLSYSRATWMGFIAAMPLFYLINLKLIDESSKKSFVKDAFITLLAQAPLIGVLYFQFHLKGIVPAILFIGLNMAFVLYALRINIQNSLKTLPKTEWLTIVNIIGILILNVFLNMTDYIGDWGWLVHIGLSALFIRIAMTIQGPLKKWLARLAIILCFAQLQFVPLSFSEAIIFFSLVAGCYFLAVKDSAINTYIKTWAFLILIGFGIILSFSGAPHYINELQNDERKIGKLENTLDTVRFKVQYYKRDGLYGSARTSMWLSAVPWVKDHPLFGSGLDTVKYMYPDYRRSDYGILEGGHNFTPDRLHNEYINTLATKGFIGFFIYYLGIIGGWFFILLRSIGNQLNNPYNLIKTGLFSGITVYLGQVLFNFGVVATLVLFYIFFGLGLALAKHKDFAWETTDEPD